MSFNTPSDVRRVLHLENNNEILSDSEIQTYLNEAEEDMYQLIRRKYETDEFYVVYDNKGNLITKYTIFYKPILSIISVELNNEELTETTDYTIDLESGVLELLIDVKYNDKLVINYEPKLYKTLELYTAVFNILRNTRLLDRDGESDLNVNNIKDKMDLTLNYLNNKLLVNKWY